MAPSEFGPLDPLTTNPDTTAGAAEPGKQVSLSDFMDLTGYTGTNYNMGVLNEEEYNPELTPYNWRGHGGTRGVFDKMRRTEPIVQAIVFGVIFPIISAQWVVEAPPEATPKEEEAAEFVKWALFTGQNNTWSGFLEQALKFPFFGFMLFEWNLRIEQKNPQWRGRYTLDHLSPRMPWSVDEWLVNEREQWQGIRQITPWGKTEAHTVPASRLIRLTFQQEGGNFEGISIMRPCYRPWYLKQQISTMMGIAADRYAVPTPIVYLPPTKDTQFLRQVKEAVEDYRSHQKARLILPNTARVEFPNMSAAQYDFIGVLNNLSNDIALSALLSFLTLGQQKGAYNLGESLKDVANKAYQFIADKVCEVFNDGQDGYQPLITRLTELNYGPDVRPPKLVVSNIQHDILGLWEMLSELTKSGVITPDEGIENRIRERMKLPPRPATTTTKPAAMEAHTCGSGCGHHLEGELSASDRTPPKAAQENAKKVLDWRRRGIAEGMTEVGWARAEQLARGGPIPLEDIRKMAGFNRHRQNSQIDPQFKSEPWRDRGYVAWLGWGGDEGIDWAIRVSQQAAAIGLEAPPPKEGAYWRPLRPYERFVALSEVVQVQDKTGDLVGETLRNWERQFADWWIKESTPLIQQGNSVRVAQLQIPDDLLNQAIEEVYQAMTRATESGYEAVVAEYERQLGRAAPPELFPGLRPGGAIQVKRGELPKSALWSGTLRGSATEAVLWTADHVLQPLRAQAISQAQSKAPNPDALTDSARSLSLARVLDKGKQAAIVAYSEGRDLAGVLAKERGQVEMVVYSAILDSGTCDPCRRADSLYGEPGEPGVVGTSGIPPHLQQRLTPPNPDCKGRNRCRCLKIWIFREI